VRVFLFTLAGIPILIADGVLLYTIPVPVGRILVREEGWLLLCGAAAYLLTHLFLRKPERIYLWGHEFSHLIVAKLFFRKIHQFQISSRTGGKVVMDRTNVMIDLAPYTVPLYCLAAAVSAQIFRHASPWVSDVYLVLASFLFTMHLLFSAEGFLNAQPDLMRSGLLFSVAVILFFLLLWIPILLAPGAGKGYQGAFDAYRSWETSGLAAARSLIDFIRRMLPA
jgi:Peptidase M50B-like